MEWKLFDGDVAEVSTKEFHKHRGRAAHLEQADHRERLKMAARFVDAAITVLTEEREPVSVSDLGCGDGGLLSLIAEQHPDVPAWGYDFTPANTAGWSERGVTGHALDVFGADRSEVKLGSIVVMTEVLEHLTDPHGVLSWLTGCSGVRYLVCSSPWTETPDAHDECHAWAWDFHGYWTLLEYNGWQVELRHKVGMFQVVLASVQART